MIRLALLGKNIAHSKSQEVYEKLLGKKIHYELLDCASKEEIPPLREIFENYKLDGLSITAPYKKVFSQNPVNTVSKTLQMANTDYIAVKELLINLPHEKIIILGDGVMSDVTANILDELNIQYEILSRKKTKDFYKLDFSRYGHNFLLINACSREYNFSSENIAQCNLFWDYNYEHEHNRQFVASLGVKYIDGSSLLELQAKHALKFWNLNV